MQEIIFITIYMEGCGCLVKKIMFISTGGTIAMTKDSRGLDQPSLSGELLAASVPGLEKGAQVETTTWKNVPSCHLNFNDVLELAGRLRSLYQQGFDGVVIAHGTDTLEETAYFLDLVCDIPMTIVLTGAQRSLSQLSSDGPMNIRDAVLVAAHEQAKDQGVLVVFNAEAHAARDVTKTHSMKAETFQSPEFGPLAVLSNNNVIWYRKPVVRESYQVNSIIEKVSLYRVCMGDDSTFLEAAVSAGAKGIVLETMGGGHVPPALLPGIEHALSTGLPVVLTTRCWGRLFMNTYGFVGSEKHLRQLGAIWGDGLSGIKARVKLTVLLSASFDLDRIRYEMEKNMYL